MKKIIVIIMIFFIGIIGVMASDTSEEFYSGDWIPNIYIDKVKNGTIHYRQARFIKRKSNKDIAYCIEPFEDMKYNDNYNGYTSDYSNHLGISDSTWKRISRIAYFGYGYADHTSDKWYAITQVMIWREVDKSAQFYFTDSLNGNKTNKYDDEINEINKLISSNTKLPSFANKTYDFSINSTNTLVDTNSVLNMFEFNYSNDLLEIKKEGNNLIIKSTSDTNVNVSFEKRFNNYNTKTIVFVDSSYQNLMTPGNIDGLVFDLKLNIKSGRIKITKVDSDTLEKTPNGEGRLIGSKYGVYDLNGNIIDEMVIDDENESISNSLPFGNYIIKEIESMEGYLLDENEYEVNIDNDNLFVDLVLKNKAIKSTIEIYKYYDEKLESGISFDIYDCNNNLIDTVTTDEYGRITKELYYGKYRFHQLNTTKNYKYVDDFEVIIDEDSHEIIRLDLKDEKISSKLIITKKDKQGNIIKEETIFKIFNIEKNEYLKIDNNEELKTKNGILVIEKLYAGSYELEEFKAPNGYKKLNDKISFIIDEDTVKKEEDYYLYEIDVENEKIELKVPNTNQEIEETIYLLDDKKKKLTIFS